jgi:uncharacterized protein YciI
MDRRMAQRPSHLVRTKEAFARGNVLAGGALLDDKGKMVGSMMILRGESESAVRYVSPYATAPLQCKKTDDARWGKCNAGFRLVRCREYLDKDPYVVGKVWEDLKLTPLQLARLADTAS